MQEVLTCRKQCAPVLKGVNAKLNELSKKNKDNQGKLGAVKETITGKTLEANSGGSKKLV